MGKKKIIAINGSPRKRGSTAVLLENVLSGAEEAGAKTKLIHLYEYTYQGCISCFACKKKSTKYWGRCAMKDKLTPILEKALEADGLILGTPVYLNNISGMMQSFIERLIYPCVSYEVENGSQYGRKTDTAFIYTMDMTEKQFYDSGFTQMIKTQEQYMQLLNGFTERLVSSDTYQFKNYAKYNTGLIDEMHKAEVKLHQFPKDCQNAYELGIRMGDPVR